MICRERLTCRERLSRSSARIGSARTSLPGVHNVRSVRDGGYAPLRGP